MARLFPFRSETTARDGTPRVVDLEGEDADAVFSALSSTTARRIYAHLDDEPGTPSDVADAIDSSIQNVRYHLENLEDAGLIEVVDTWYSSRGNEMSVYGTTDGPLIVTSDESTASQLKTAISRLIGGIGALAGGSLLVQYGVSRWFGSSGIAADESAPLGNGDSAPAGADADEDAANGYAAADDSVDETADPPPGDEPTDDTPPEDESVEDAPSEDEPVDAEEDELDAADVDDGDDEDDELSAEAVAEDDSPDETPEDDSLDDVATDESEDLAVDDDADARTDDGESTEFDGGAEPPADDGQYMVDGGAEATDAVVGTVPPGLLFFLGGLVVLLAITAYWYWSQPSY
ncbi:ArsR/SmtB family transcription factor [Natrarchaeobius sp. A-rgal3]|uniref:ArsR/SmtB family transcription factor n=1 Tax=Natrarchaeobius versutus TaxID=1679078 RepID=UPI00350F265E